MTVSRNINKTKTALTAPSASRAKPEAVKAWSELSDEQAIERVNIGGKVFQLAA